MNYRVHEAGIGMVLGVAWPQWLENGGRDYFTVSKHITA